MLLKISTHPREVIFLDILPPLYRYSLDSATTFEAWIMFFDLYSSFAHIYGLTALITNEVCRAMNQLIMQYGAADKFKFADIAKVKMDAGPQFVSAEFQRYCSDSCINLSIAPPEHQELNHGAERHWQTLKKMIHAC